MGNTTPRGNSSAQRLEPHQAELMPFCPHSVRKFFLDGCTSASFEGLEKHEAAGAKVSNELFPKQPKKVRDSVIKVGPTGRRRAFQHFEDLRLAKAQPMAFRRPQNLPRLAIGTLIAFSTTAALRSAWHLGFGAEC